MALPILLTVDDDPSVSRAVARDLRRRYGSDYRVIRAGSGADALDALRELKLRGDSVAAILAVDIDHYLLKPWNPPEEKLYPVVDALVETWRAADDRPVEEIKLVGHRWSRHSYQVRDFLARNSVSYRWYSVDEPEGQRLLGAAGAEPEEIPVG